MGTWQRRWVADGVSVEILTNGCSTGATLEVEIGLATSTGIAGLWDVALWDADFWGPDVVWTSVSDWVQGVTSTRKFSRGQKVWSSGTITVTLNNASGRFSVDNLDPLAPYVVAGVSSIRPGVPIRCSITYSGVTYPLFYGYVVSWGEVTTGKGPRTGGAYVEVSGTDEWGRLAKAKGFAVSPSVGASDTYGARVVRILNAAGFTGSINADVGYTTFQATDLSAERVTELNEVARAEGGAIWAEADGSIIARDRYSLVENIRSVEPQAVFGDGDTDTQVCWLNAPWSPPDGDGEVPWASVQMTPLTDEMIINHTVYKRVGGTEQQYVDPISVALYGDRTDKPSDFLSETDAQVAALAEWIVLVNKYPEARVVNIAFVVGCNTVELLPLLLGLKIQDLVLFKLRPPSDYTTHEMERYCHIHGITIAIGSNDMAVSFDLESATAYREYALSRWDIGTWGASDVDTTGARWFV